MANENNHKTDFGDQAVQIIDEDMETMAARLLGDRILSPDDNAWFHSGPDDPIDRRRFLALTTKTGVAVAVGLGALQANARSREGVAVPTSFLHGVASGDPLPDRVVIWTRVTPSPEATPGSGLGAPTQVTWQVSRSRLFAALSASGLVTTDPATDHIIKIDVAGLNSSTNYFYRFLVDGQPANSSPVGQTRTSPLSSAANSSLRFGVVSCSNFEGGYFSAYRHLARRTDLDFVLHLGDYIYEYETGRYGPGPAIGRMHDPLTEMITLEDYRRRHACYKRDPDLQALHARYAFITTWDDHEVTNDAYVDGAENHQPGLEGDYLTRRNFAYQAYFEWMPIRLPDPVNAPTRIYRRFQFGTLADLSMLDLRQYRDIQAPNGAAPSDSQPSPAREIDDPDRTLTGAEQLAWIKDNLSASATRWKLVGNSIMVAPIDFAAPGVPPEVLAQLGLMMGVPYNVDQWDGYRDDRRELLNHIAGNTADGLPAPAKINNVVFLTGDIHSSWACDIPRQPGNYPLASQSVAVEFVGTSITSDNLDEITSSPPRTSSLSVENVFKGANRHVKLLEFDSHGYSVLDVTPQRVQMDWFYISNREDPNATQRFATAWLTRNGNNFVERAAGPLGPRPLGA